MAKTVAEHFLEALAQPPVPANAIPVDGVATKDVVVEKESDIWVRLFLPDGTSNKRLPVLFFFHGGGFQYFSPKTIVFDRFCRDVARDLEVIVVSVNYRLAPQHKYPAALEDSFKAVQWLSKHHQEHLPSSADVSRCFLAGDSAGGNIVHHVGVKAAESAQELKPLSVVGHILLWPYFGGEERVQSELTILNPELVTVQECDRSWEIYLPEGATRDHAGCKVFGPHSKGVTDIALPPSLVVLAEQDVLRDWGVKYSEDMKQQGKHVQVELVKGAFHAFCLFPDHPDRPLVLDILRRFILAQSAVLQPS